MTKRITKTQAISDKKTQLLLSGSYYRAQMMQSKAVVIQHIHSESIIKSVLKNAFGLMSMKLFSSSGSSTSSNESSTNWSSYIPLAISVFSFLSRKKLIKPTLVVGLLAGVALIQSKNIRTWLQSFSNKKTDESTNQ